MRRRDFLKSAGAAGAALATTAAWTPTGRAGSRRAGSEPSADPAEQGLPALPDETFRRRRDRAARLMSQGDFDALFAEPSTNFEYLTGANLGRSERLIALILTADGVATIVAPEFEVERVSRAVRAVPDVRGWAEQADPYRLVADVLSKRRPGAIGIEPRARFGVVQRMKAVLPRWRVNGAEPLFTRLRIIKSEEELTLIRRAISITDTSIAATFAALRPGVTDREVAERLSREMRERGAPGGGLVQFGPTSALPHGGTEGRQLEYGMPVLIDCGCRVHGYTSDITRMRFFGDEPGADYREVFNTVLSAQTAAYEAARPGMEAQALDRIARQVITEAGYGQHFTHRLGHGLGMDGHEPPYLVQGNTRTIEPGMVFTIEPGIYLPERWGVRIEDDFVVRETGLEPLSTRVAPL